MAALKKVPSNLLETLISTSQGDDDACGIIPRVVRDVFRHVEESADCSEYTIKVSFFEILNEKIFDLLKTMKVPLALKEAGTEFYIPDLKCAAVATEDEAITLLEHGCKTRATGATAQNAHRYAILI